MYCTSRLKDLVYDYFDVFIKDNYDNELVIANNKNHKCIKLHKIPVTVIYKICFR